MKISGKYPILKSIIAWQSENVNLSACKVIIYGVYWDKIKSVVYFFRCFRETMWMLQNMVDTVEMEYLLLSPRPATLSPSCSAQTLPYSNQDSQPPTANLHLVSLDSMLVFQHWCAWLYIYVSILLAEQVLKTYITMHEWKIANKILNELTENITFP